MIMLAASQRQIYDIMMYGPQNVKRILDIVNSVDFIVILSVSIILKYHITLSYNYKKLKW